VHVLANFATNYCNLEAQIEVVQSEMKALQLKDKVELISAHEIADTVVSPFGQVLKTDFLKI
jgi:hypothetical protein